MKAYNQLELIFKEIGLIQSLAALGQWDNSVTMPKGGSNLKQEQLAYLSELKSHKIHNPQLNDLVAEAELESLNDWQVANLRKIKNICLHEQAIDSKLAAELIRAKLKCESSWVAARQNNDFKIFTKSFSPLLQLIKEVAQVKAEILNKTQYNALLDEYDENRNSKDIDIIFNQLEDFLPQFIAQVKEKQNNIKVKNFNIPIAKQKEIGRFCMNALGFDFNRGRLDESVHPFSTGFSPDDVRITARYSENSFVLEGLAAVLHETGHAIYEQNLPKEFIWQPVACASGMTIHESQSLFVERHIGINKEFFTLLSTKFNEIDVDGMYNVATKVGESLIRVEADEVTYPAHVMMRYKIEKSLLNNEIEINDLPSIWDQYSLNLFGRKPSNLKEGCLQDIHWSWGAIGYFPTYTLGAIFASQINACLKTSLDINELIKSGNFAPIFSWLKQNIHSLGSKLTPSDLMLNSVGSDLNVKIYQEYLIKKYLE